MGVTGVRQTNMAYWYDVLEKSCQDLLGFGGGPPLLRFVLPSYFGKTLMAHGLGCGHPIGPRVRTPSRLMSEDTLTALG